MKHGKGTDIFANGDCYTGNYAFGKADGKGVYKWKNGSIYSEEFKERMKHGRKLPIVPSVIDLKDFMLLIKLLLIIKFEIIQHKLNGNSDK